ncbi:hypothetical protein GCM10009836_01750 [Pseudonocardia ailaonensis]|uniref:ABC transporter domain-containing protein n=1 Tax=Pseudonocardia ailaonensis TaxID=367279 RepID=A0ABN2MHS9_9PSEU
MQQVIQYTLLAAGSAAIYALVASGIIVVQRGSRILNFAQGTYVMFGAYLFHALRASGWALAPAAVGTVVAIGLIGAATYLLIIRPLRNNSLISRIVGTLAVVIILTEFVNLVWKTAGEVVEGVLPSRALSILGTEVGLDRLLLLAIAVVVAALLWAAYRFTTFGLATSATSENRRAAAALGWSADTIAVSSWALSGVISGVAAILIAPVQAALDPTALTLTIVPALAVAVVASFRSFPVALVTAAVLAAVTSYINGVVVGNNQELLGVGSLVPLLVIIVVLAFKGDRLPPRGHATERRPRLGSGTVRPVAVVVALAVVLLAVWTVLPADWIKAVSSQAAFAILLLSVVVVLGYAGQLSLGQFALAGVAALVSGRLVAIAGLPFWLAAVVGVVVATVTGSLFALPALRTRSVALGIVTLGLGASVYELFFLRMYQTPPPGGASSDAFGVNREGTVITDLQLFGIDIGPKAHPEAYATLCLLACTVIALAVVNLRRGRAGRRLVAVRTNERAAAALGVSVPTAKFYAFALSAAVAGVSGILISFSQSVIVYNTDYNPLQSIYAVAFGVVGGVGAALGAFFGAMLFPGTLGASATHDIGDWLADVGSPPGWISAGILLLLVSTIVRLVRRRTEVPRWVMPAAAVVAIVVGVLFPAGVGWVLGQIDSVIGLAPWLGALVVARLVTVLAKLVPAYRRAQGLVQLATFVVVAVVARVLVAEQLNVFMTELSRFLPLIGGVILVVILVRHGDGLAHHAAANARKIFVKPHDETFVTASEEARPDAVRGGLLTISGLSVNFGGVKALDSVDLQVNPGEVLGVIGPNGAGKSTLVDAITGYNSPGAGTITLDGRSLSAVPAHLRARLGIARTFQQLELFDDLTVLENLAAASDAHDTTAYLTGLVAPGRPVLSPMAADAVATFDLGPALGMRAQDLPHGRRRLVAVARAVAASPRVLLLDEPAAGLDDDQRRELGRVIRELATAHGLSVVVIEHDMGFIMSLCDRIAVLDFGRKIADASPAEVQADPVVVAAYLGAQVDEETDGHQDGPQAGELASVSENNRIEAS